MAKQTQKPATRKPITSHPLFPAVVALWFGALFGLGSLAVRPSLIENLVLSTRLDLIIPAAAPPLGLTARIAIAMILAAIGALIGMLLTRRLNKPKVEQRERTRGAREFGQAKAKQPPAYARGDAPACTPISMRDLGESLDTDAAAATNEIPGRRRGLTADHGEDQFVPHDFAPLPGGAPQIQDLGDRASAVPVLPHVPIVAQPAQPQPQAAFEAPVQAPAPAAMAPQPAPQQTFQAPPQSEVTLSPDSAAAHADGRQVFGIEPAQPPVEQPRQIFGAAVDGDHVSPDFIRDAGYQTTVFNTETAPPLFERSAAEPAPAAAVAAPPLPAAVEPAAPAQPFAPAPVAQAQPELAAAPAPEPQASPASLGMTDLASRLAESMRRRRAAKAGAAEAVAAPQVEPQPAPAAFAPIAPQPQAFEAPVAAAPAPQAYEAPAPVAVAAPVPQAFEVPVAAPVEAPAPQAFEAPAPIPQAFAQPAPQPVPQAVEAPAPIPQAFEQPVPQPVAPVSQAPQAPAPMAELPSALRPLALDAFLEDDTALDPSVLPPRHMAMPAAIPPAAPVGQPLAFEDPRAAAAEEEVADEPIAEENYGSLLGIAQPRGGFVRIEEPEGNAADPEPVVIFPGQGGFAAPAAAAPVVPQVPAADGFRRFDSPAAAGAGQPVAHDLNAPAVDSSAADQALRSALANLQRMSGAA